MSNNLNHPYSTIHDLDTNIKINQQKEFKLGKFILKVTIGLLIFIAIYSLISHQPDHINSITAPVVDVDSNSIITSFEHIQHPEIPSKLWGKIAKPYPTGAFWTNLVVKNGDGIIGLYPYGIKTLKEGLQVSYGASRRMLTKTIISDVFVIDLQISAVETYLSREVIKYDELSVTMEYTTITNHNYKVFLVKCSPFVTVYYNETTPIISSPFMQITDVNIVDTKEYSLKTNSKVYLLTLGNFQRWLVYSSNPLIWTTNTLTARYSMVGFVRVAILPAQNYELAYKSLLPYIEKYPIGGSVSFTYPNTIHNNNLQQQQSNPLLRYEQKDPNSQSSSSSSKSNAILTITYMTEGDGDLVMLALPHQYDIMISPILVLEHSTTTIDNNVFVNNHKHDAKSLLVYENYHPIWCIKGKMKAVVGDIWKLEYKLDDINFDYHNYNNIDKNNQQIKEIKKYLLKEVHEIIPTAPDPYGFGKEASRMARLALIAELLNDTESKDIALNHIKQALELWLMNRNTDKLLYDNTYGGIVTFNSIQDSMSNYGSGWYNDHHFHYGYFIYTAAVIMKLDNNNNTFFINNKLSAIEAIVNDICNYNPKSNLLFPYVRHKDMYDGHSWASGLFQQGNGKGQESSSEAINAYYAVYLYSKVINNQELMQFVHVMLSMEIHSTKYYWHMNSDITATTYTTTTSTTTNNNNNNIDNNIKSTNNKIDNSVLQVINSKNQIYDKLFAHSRMVGNIGALDVTASTWFGDKPEYVHGINIMPITPITEILFDLEYIKIEYPILLHRLNVTSSIETEDVNNYPSDCAYNPVCNALGLQGQCCPVLKGGNMLECCDVIQNKDNNNPDKIKTNEIITDEWISLIYMTLAVCDKNTAWDKVVKLNQFGSGNSKTNSLYWIFTRDKSINCFSSHNNHNNNLIPILCSQNSPCDALGMEGNCCPTDMNSYLQCCPKE